MTAVPAVPPDLYRYLFEHSLDAVFLTHPDGRIVRANPAACRLVDRTEEEILQVGRAGLVDLRDPRLLPALKKREETGKVRSGLRFLRRDGTPVECEASSSVFAGEDGLLWTVIIVRDVSSYHRIQRDLRAARKQAVDLACLDSLTGILNRRAFLEQLERRIGRARSTGLPLSLLLMDVDRFKSINDTYGHLAGDDVLILFSRTVAGALRQQDLLGRYGGDEFIVCLPDTGGPDALAVAGRIHQAVSSTPHPIAGRDLRITASIGVALFQPEDGPEDIRSLVNRADMAMYQAKSRGEKILAAF